MKHTVKIDVQKGIQVEPKGGNVEVTLTTFNFPAIVQQLTPDQALVLGNALLQVAEDAAMEHEFETGASGS